MYEPIGAQMLAMKLLGCKISADLQIHVATVGVIGDSTVTRKKGLFYSILLARKATEASCFVILCLKSKIIINYYDSYMHGHPLHAESLFLTLRISFSDFQVTYFSRILIVLTIHLDTMHV